MLRPSDVQYVDKYFVLSRCRQEEIFQFYMEIPIELDFQFRSPLRKDKNPTCSMGYFGGKLLFRDWSVPKALDCFDFVQQKLNLNYGRALERIVSDLDLMDREPNQDVPAIYRSRRSGKNGKSRKKQIKVRIQPVQKPELDFWSQFHIGLKTIEKFKCFSIERIWLQGKPQYRYRNIDPAVGYYLGDDEFGDQRWKIYFYLRHGLGRFMGNTNRINGWVQLPRTSEVLVITKSMKDVMVLDMFDIPAIAMQSETTMPYERIIVELKARFRNIFTLYDFDYAGVRGAMKIRSEYDIQPLFLTNGRFGSTDFEAKDISDFIKNRGIMYTQEMLQNAANHLSLDIKPEYCDV